MSEKKGEVWQRCGRCRGVGTVANMNGAVTCPECSGSGMKKVGKIKQEKSLETGLPLPGRFVIELEDAESPRDMDDFKIVISMFPINLPTSPRTGRALALYDVDERTNTITCRESKISVKSIRGYVCQGDIKKLDEACPEHQHENLYTLEQEILEPRDWDDADEVGAMTIHGKIS